MRSAPLQRPARSSCLTVVASSAAGQASAKTAARRVNQAGARRSVSRADAELPYSPGGRGIQGWEFIRWVGSFGDMETYLRRSSTNEIPEGKSSLPTGEELNCI